LKCASTSMIRPREREVKAETEGHRCGPRRVLAADRLLGRAAGLLMAHRSSNHKRNAWAVSLLEVRPDDRVLEIGFVPGLAVRELSRIAHAPEPGGRVRARRERRGRVTARRPSRA
jgi:hypothetical protein